MHQLIVCNPGHFHAALTLRQSHPSLSDEVHVYSLPGPDLERFQAIVKSYNERAENPTRWSLHVVTAADYLDRLIKERPGDLCVVAGRTDLKAAQLPRLHEAGFALLADKPWLLTAADLPKIRQVTAGGAPAIDIMTNRHEVLFRLLRALAADDELFGGFFQTGPEDPALSIRSAHHLYKIVAGKPLRRPAWFFDTKAQGKGIVDISTHLIDLCMFILSGPEQPARAFTFGKDAGFIAAKRTATPLSREMFGRITGLDDFPEAIRASVQGDTLAYDCNGEIMFRLGGQTCRTVETWEVQDPPGKDWHQATAFGNKCIIEIKQGPETDYRDELFVYPKGAAAALRPALEAALARLQPDFPGISAGAGAGNVWKIDVPGALRIPHEAQYALVRDGFIGALGGKDFSKSESANLLAKYSIIAEAERRSVAG